MKRKNVYKEMLDKYNGSLDAMWILFNKGRDIEQRLEFQINLMQDEFKRIKVISKNSEITQICCRAIERSEKEAFDYENYYGKAIRPQEGEDERSHKTIKSTL